MKFKKCLILGRKALTKLDSILKSKEITLPTKVCLVKAMAFPVVMYGCESWAIKKAECRRIDAFELWCWRRLLRVPWTARSSNQSILKETSPGCSLEGLMLRLKLQYFGHMMWKTDSFEKTLMLGKIEVGRRSGWQRMRWLDGITTWWTWVWVNSGSWWWTGRPGMLQSMGSRKVGHEWLNWTEGHTVTAALPCSSHGLSSLRTCPRSPLHKCLLSLARCSDILQSHSGATGWCWCQNRFEPKESKVSKGWGHQGCHMEPCAAVLVSVTQPCLTLGNPVDCSPPGSSVHGILQARILECVQHNLHANDKTMACI